MQSEQKDASEIQKSNTVTETEIACQRLSYLASLIDSIGEISLSMTLINKAIDCDLSHILNSQLANCAIGRQNSFEKVVCALLRPLQKVISSVVLCREDQSGKLFKLELDLLKTLSKLEAYRKTKRSTQKPPNVVTRSQTAAKEPP